MTATLEKMLCPPIRVMALRDKDTESLFRSASGGAFSVLARPVLRKGGVVFGAEMLEKGKVRQVQITDAGELSRLQGSKYVQSDTAGTFSECANALRAGKTVLYSGTPCQVFALRSYLKREGMGDKDLELLLTVDLICHGVTSPKLFRLYIDWLEKKVGAVPGSLYYEFRSKKQGWGLNYSYSFTSKKDGKKHDRFGGCEDDPYYMAFLEGQLYRSSCYKCRFARKERVGDFTIGDFWGVQREHPDFYCCDGVSVVLINTLKGDGYFQKYCIGDCLVKKSDWEKACRENHNLLNPTKQSEKGAELARKVEEAMANEDSNLLFAQLLKRPWSIKGMIKKALPDSLTLQLKRIIGK